MKNDAYVEQILDMVEKGERWLREHPNLDIRVQWNFPSRVMLVSDLEDAIEKHFVSVNEAGREMLDAMSAGIPSPLRPTVFMMRLAFDTIGERAADRRIPVPPSECPTCGAVLDRAQPGPSEPQDAKPEPGFPSICGKCSEILVYDENLRLRAPTDAEIAGFKEVDGGEFWKSLCAARDEVTQYRKRIP